MNIYGNDVSMLACSLENICFTMASCQECSRAVFDDN